MVSLDSTTYTEIRPENKDLLQCFLFSVTNVLLCPVKKTNGQTDGPTDSCVYNNTYLYSFLNLNLNVLK